MKELMKYFLCIIIFLFIASTVFAEDNIQQAHIKQGFDYIDVARYRDAIHVFMKVLETNPDNAEAYYGLGISYLRLGDTITVTIPQLVQEAIYSFKKAQNFGASHPEIYYSLGLCYLALKDKELAIKQYDALEGLNRDLADQLLNKIVEYERLHEETAIQEKVIPSDEKN
jgi:tetratricopeptide (TPR) repeat protein